MGKTIKQYVVDAFTDKVFHGNPAAICILEEWLPDELMMNITIENNLSETAFAVKEDGCYHLRWFTPSGEIDLCGHATLACAFVLMHYYEQDADRIAFQTLSGKLAVEKSGEMYEMDFPAYYLHPVDVTKQIIDAVGAVPVEAYMGRDLLCIFDSEETVRALRPNQEKLQTLDGLLLQATAKGAETDCVSRSFGPKCGIAEDPVCGSGHCHIVPYWAKKTGKNQLVAYQASRRGGTLYCRMQGGGCCWLGKQCYILAQSLTCK